MYKTEQEAFWAGEFGNEYIKRNVAWARNVPLFSTILSKSPGVDSILEFGANIGQNMHALRVLKPKAELSAIEINEKAAEYLRTSDFALKDVFNTSILEFDGKEKYDMTLIKGVLIHINPENLQEVYKRLYDSSKRYICLVEYYNRTPVEIEYRGHSGKLFKRDFAGEMLDKYSDLHLVDYGFVYHRDEFPQDDATWFLMEKRG